MGGMDWGVSERGECGEKGIGGMSVGACLRIE